MAVRLIVGGDEDAFYAKKNGVPWGDKPYAIWSALTGGSRYTDVLHVDGTAAGDGAINDVHYTGGVLLTGPVDGSFGAQLPDGLDVPGVWIDLDGRDSRVFLPARQPDGSLPVSAQGASSAAIAAEVTARQNADAGLTPQTRTVAGHPLTSDVTLVKGDVGLSNVDNTADAGKPVSTAQASADLAARDAAISAAASDATTKANAARSGATSDAAADATTKVNAIKPTDGGVAVSGPQATATATGRAAALALALGG